MIQGRKLSCLAELKLHVVVEICFFYMQLYHGISDKISSGGARVDNDVQSISNGLVLSSTVPRVDNDANINQLST